MTQHRRRTSSVIGAAFLLVAASASLTPTLADEIEDSITSALEAYRSGDMMAAKSEVDYAAQLLSQMRSEALMDILPAPFAGWSQEEAENAAFGAAMFGGGLTASADYRKDDRNVEIQVMADSPLLAAMASMFTNPAMIGGNGKLKRLDGHKVIETKGGELQAMVANRFMVQIGGSAPIEDKEAYFSAIDFDALSSF